MAVHEAKQRMTPSEAFVETLVAHGVSDVFGIVGSAYMDAHDLFPLAGIRFISTAHEQNAAHMADGYARATGRHGVCIAQNGPGVTNFVTAIAAAYWAHSPVVAITPESGSASAGLGGFQETDQMPIFSKITRWQTHVNSPARIAELTARAFHYALQERGPVQVNIPRDYFYGEIETEIPAPFRVRLGPGNHQDIREAARLLADAAFPVIIAGGGVIMADGVSELAELAETLSAPVVNSYLHNDSFPASHPLAVGPLGYQGSKAAMRLISQADVVLAMGSRLGPFGTLPQYGLDYWPEQARIIQVDADPRVLGLVKKIALGIHGDARDAAEALTAAIRELRGPMPPDADRLARISTEKQIWEKELAGFAGTNAHGRVDPRRALAELARARPENAMVATDIGNVCSVANSYLSFEKPASFFAAMSFGNCGYAFPTAIGAKVGRPDRPSIAYVGDGAWGMSLAEVMTCVRENIPVVAVVFDNGQWGAEKRNQIDYFDRRFLGTELENPDFAVVAQAMGAQGISVSHEDQIGDALRTAIRSERPTVINLRLTQALGAPFRRDAFRPPRRLLRKYAAHGAKE
ncbi:sulfoacetaldehyde acetyltransferase [Ectothiorhodospira lacustris]|uniref:sulfoacetaldehyde acetyltransferase n=1 Tax=Ectothiorhodospira lacustris TaxID=2899127 RepID=UPI001EE84B45|nr:sulfoacetaldehyde acetyltransferase [Ectothiorhodospira lacustris]MCG5501333.1 sulfoacetaldehyde acetyltransferase [Ectothiorhodospira lacustris]